MDRENKYIKLKEDMSRHSLADYPLEACGIITTDFIYVPCKNISFQPKESFILDPIALLEHEDDCWGMDLDLIPKINIYLYDGKHDQISQYRAFTHFNRILDDEFIAIVDDWNVPHVKKGTLDAFNDLEYKVEYQWERLTKTNGDRGDFWNGFFIAVVKK